MVPKALLARSAAGRSKKESDPTAAKHPFQNARRSVR